jgi:nucleoside-diphosphate-sugar epimerase
MPIKLSPPIDEEFPIMGNSVYGCSKALAEMYVNTHNPHISLRYAHLYGAEKRFHGLIGGFLSRIEHDLEPVLYGGKQSNDFTYIKDIARANMIALTASWDKWNQSYNIGTGEELTAEEAGKIICKYAGYKGEIKIEPARTVDPERFVYDMSKTNNKLGFKAEYNFDRGIKDMFNEIPKHVRK